MVESKYYTPPLQPELQLEPMPASRREKRERSHLIKQTIFFFGAAAIFLAIFFLVVIPGIIRLVSSAMGKDNTETEQQLPPQPPFLSAPVPATSSAQLTLKGYQQKNQKIIILENAQEATRVSVQDDGSFSADVTLQEGENTLSAVAVDAQDQRSQPSAEFKVVLDTQAPAIEVSDPKDGSSIQGKKNQMVTLKGKTDVGSKVYLNDRLVYVQADGTFSTTYRLENGKNDLVFKAIDQAGNSQELKMSISFAE